MKKIKQPKVKVETRTIDNILKDMGMRDVDLMKMDIQGAEIEALQGAKRTLNKTDKIIIFGNHIRDGHATAKRVAKFLEELGFDTKINESKIVHAFKRSDSVE